MHRQIGPTLGVIAASFALGGCPDAIPVVVGGNGGAGGYPSSSTGISTGMGNFGGFGNSSGSSSNAGGGGGSVLQGKRVFLTAGPVPADFGGTFESDAICQEIANKSSFGGIWYSWTSDLTTSPAARFTKSSGPYRLLDGTLIANNWGDLTDGTLQHAIDMDYDKMTQNVEVWTGTLANGKADPMSTYCLQWTSVDVADTGTAGVSGVTNSKWTNVDPGFGQSCDRSGLYLYCFEQ